MKVVADERVDALEATFGRHAEIQALDGGAIGRQHLLDADALILRTITRVDRNLLEGTAIKFVGTASIGFDHLDTAYLGSANIPWANAPGCNADATSQYTLAMFLLACRRLAIDPSGLRYGVVGRGNVGSRVVKLLQMMGVECVACDPPLENAGEENLVSMEEILECGVISLHVPLTRTGRWPTFRMVDSSMLQRLSPTTLLINSARGDVIDGAALKDWIKSGGRPALDVWPGEPDIDSRILEGAVVASPHIAGYSLDGKLRASAMVYRAFCDTFGLTPEGMPQPELEGPSAAGLEGKPLMEAVLNNNPVIADDRSMRTLLELPEARRRDAFNALRSNYVLRRELSL